MRNSSTNKIYVYTLVLLMLILIPSCVTPSHFIDGSSDVVESSSNEQQLFPDYVYDQEQVQTLTSVTGKGLAISEEGYYFIEKKILHYYDISEGAAFPLCTKTSCMHTDKNCDAYIYDYSDEKPDWVTNCLGDKVFFYNDHLYMMSQQWDASPVLFQYNKDFTERKEIGRMSDGSASPRVLTQDVSSSLVHNGWLYYLTLEMREDWFSSQDPKLLTVPYTLCRIKLEEKSEREELYTFEFPIDYDVLTATSQGIRLMNSGDDIYCIASIRYRFNTTTDPVQQRVIRYNESEGAELLWTYTGEERINLFGSEGEVPVHMLHSSMNESRDFSYMTFGPDEKKDMWNPFTSIWSVNMESKESRKIYQTPYSQLFDFITDGNNYYFTEIAPGQCFLTAIDHEGKLIRRYEFEYSDSYIKTMEEKNIPREQWTGGAGLMLIDGRYIMLGSAGYSAVLKGLTSDEIDENTLVYGMIRLEDFLDGKDVEIQQIYE